MPRLSSLTRFATQRQLLIQLNLYAVLKIAPIEAGLAY